MKTISITTPLTEEAIENLHSGDKVLISGVIYTARDAAHKRLLDAIEKGEALPFKLRGQIIYYVGPTPAKPGKVIGSAGPTTSSRMDRHTSKLLDLGLKGMIGKGARSEAVRESIVKNKAVYFGAVGGIGALLAKHIVSSEIIAYEDLCTEAIRKLEVNDFPAIVINDSHGIDLFDSK